MNTPISQRDFIYRYNDKTRDVYNPFLFERDEDKITDALKKILLSCERSRKFIIKIESFEIIKDYEKMIELLQRYENETYKNSKKKKFNPYDYVTLKDSDFNLLVVNYYISIKDTECRFTGLILTPKIVDKYYFRISGNMYHAMFQIVDGSTYNNALTGSAKVPNVTFKTTFNPIKIFKKNQSIPTIENEMINLTYFNIKISSKYFDVFKYLLAKFGLVGTFQESKIGCINFSKTVVRSVDMYCFAINENLFMSVPRYLLDNDHVVQSLTCTLYRSLINVKCNIEDIYSTEFWLLNITSEFKSKNIEKGLSVLESLEVLYDTLTKENIRLPEEAKENIYRILIWTMREFQQLRLKSNLDLSTKRIRYEDYIASLYSMKLVTGIYRLTDVRAGITLDDIIKVIRIKPTYLLEAISSCRLVKYRELVNDLDSMIAGKFTFKGVSGMGEKNQNAVPPIYRYIYPEDLGRIDVDASPKSDPGRSGTFVPTVEFHDGYFSDFQEPNFWESEFTELTKNYKKMVGLKESLVFKQQVLGINVSKQLDHIEEDLEVTKRLVQSVEKAERTSELVSPFVPLRIEETGGF